MDRLELTPEQAESLSRMLPRKLSLLNSLSGASGASRYRMRLVIEPYGVTFGSHPPRYNVFVLEGGIRHDEDVV